MDTASHHTFDYDAAVIGAGAAGLFFAWKAAERGVRVLVIDHAKRLAEKIRISGGGRCNFTNMNTSPAHFLSSNPKFCISALKRFTPADFVALVDEAGIPHHEKTLGQLFCDTTAQDIIDMLRRGCSDNGVKILHPTAVGDVEQLDDGGFSLGLKSTDRDAISIGRVTAAKVIVATGGLSIPKIGATGFGYDLARKFGLTVTETRAGLVPLTFDGALLDEFSSLSGVSLPGRLGVGKTWFEEALLFTHRGLSGPAVLQISSYWQEGGDVVVDMLPGETALEWLKDAKRSHPKQILKTVLGQKLPNRLADHLAGLLDPHARRLADMPDKVLNKAAETLNRRRITPAGSEGYRTAEVTLGGVDTRQLSSTTMEAKSVPGLYFIGEVVDVTGHLGGHNFQWAWASAHAAVESISPK